MTAAPRLVLYSRPTCGLCDEAREVVLRARSTVPFELEEVNVETEDALELEYGIRVPVIAIDGRERFEISVGIAELLAALRGEERPPDPLVHS